MSLSVLELRSRPLEYHDEDSADECNFSLLEQGITRNIGNLIKPSCELQRDLKKIARNFELCYGLKHDFLDVFEEWKLSRKKTIASLDEVIVELDKIRFGTNIVKTTACVGGIISGCLGIAGAIAMSSRDGGSSLRLAAGIGNLASCTVSGAAAAAELGLSEKHMNQVKRILRNDSERFEPIQEWFERSQVLRSAIEEVCNCNIFLDFFQNLMIVVPPVISTYQSLVSHVDEVVTEVVKMLGKKITLNDFEKIVSLCVSICRDPELMNTIGNIHHMLTTASSVMPVVTMLVKVPYELKHLTQYMNRSNSKYTRAESRKEAVTYGLFQGVNVAIELFNLTLLVKDFQGGSKSERSAVLMEVKQQLETELTAVSSVHKKLNRN